MIGIIIVAHGGLAKEYLSAMEYVIGPNPGITAITILPDDDIGNKEKQISQAMTEVNDGDGVVVVTDMHGGTPANLALRACKGQKVMILFGANLPLLLKLVKVRNLSFELAVNLAIDSGKKYIDCVKPASS